MLATIKTDHPEYNRIMRGVLGLPEPTAADLARSASVHSAIERMRQEAEKVASYTGPTETQIKAQADARAARIANEARYGIVRI